MLMAVFSINKNMHRLCHWKQHAKATWVVVVVVVGSIRRGGY